MRNPNIVIDNQQINEQTSLMVTDYEQAMESFINNEDLQYSSHGWSHLG